MTEGTVTVDSGEIAIVDAACVAQDPLAPVSLGELGSFTVDNCGSGVVFRTGEDGVFRVTSTRDERGRLATITIHLR